MRRLFALGLIALVVGLTTAPALARGPRVRVAVGPANSLQATGSSCAALPATFPRARQCD